MVAGCEVVVGRQGIHDTSRRIGYELLFRTIAGDGPGLITGDEMTADVMFGAMSIGVETLAGDGLVFCNADRGVITGETPVMLDPARTVVEVLETLRIDDELVAGVMRLADAGYRIALDDFVWGSGHEALLPLASIVKIDLLLTPPGELPDVVARCRPYGVQMLAEKIEHAADLPGLAALGFEYFQGYALDRPALVHGRALAPTEAAGLQIAVDLLQGDPDIGRFEAVLRRDPALAHQVMRLASVGRAGETSRPIRTLRDALVIAGTRAVQRWLALLLACPRRDDAQPGHVVGVLLRARACELLAHESAVARSELAFTAGLLSGLQEALGLEPAEVAAHLRLSEDLWDAAFGGSSALGALVQDATEYQGRVQGTAQHATDQPDRLGQVCWRNGLHLEDFDRCFAAAFTWAMHSTEAMARTDA